MLVERTRLRVGIRGPVVADAGHADAPMALPSKTRARGRAAAAARRFMEVCGYI